MKVMNSNGQSLVKQQAALQQLKTYLGVFKDELEEHLRRYRAMVNNLHSEGLSIEVYQTYLNSYYERDRNYIDSLIHHLEEADAKYINDNLQESGVNIEVAQRSLGDF